MPASEVPLERASKTQPFPLKPPPLARMTFSKDEVATVTPELEAACRKLLEGVTWVVRICRPAYNRLRVQFPGNHGGVNWGGTSFDPQLGYLFANVNELGQVSGLQDHDPKKVRQWRTDRATEWIRMVLMKASRAVDDSAFEGPARSSFHASNRHGESLRPSM